MLKFPLGQVGLMIEQTLASNERQEECVVRRRRRRMRRR